MQGIVMSLCATFAWDISFFHVPHFLTLKWNNIFVMNALMILKVLHTMIPFCLDDCEGVA